MDYLSDVWQSVVEGVGIGLLRGTADTGNRLESTTDLPEMSDHHGRQAEGWRLVLGMFQLPPVQTDLSRPHDQVRAGPVDSSGRLEFDQNLSESAGTGTIQTPWRESQEFQASETYAQLDETYQLFRSQGLSTTVSMQQLMQQAASEEEMKIVMMFTQIQMSDRA